MNLIHVKKSQPLFGSVKISGAKNMITKIMTAALISSKGKLTIYNVPKIDEVQNHLDLFKHLSVRYRLNPDNSLVIYPSQFKLPKNEIIGGDNRISILLAGPLLLKTGRAIIAKPKGCQIGKRKIDFHIQALKKFGAEIKDLGENLEIRIGKQGLKGIKYKMPFPSVGTTENLIITGVCAHNKVSVFENCAVEPEIIELVKFLQKSGVEISLNGDRTICVVGNKNIELTDVHIVPDRVEAFSYACAALATKGNIFLEEITQDLIVTPLSIFNKMGAGIRIKENGIQIYYKGPLNPIKTYTNVYPGFPTDFQQPLSVLLSQVSGQSEVHETIFEKRFDYLNVLNTVAEKNFFELKTSCPTGKKCRFYKQSFEHYAKIFGPTKFGTGRVSIPDLRAGFAILIAGLVSAGMTIENTELLFRGYENPVEKLRVLGANIKTI